MTLKIKNIIFIMRYMRKLEPRALYYGMFGAILNALSPFIALIISKILIEAVLSGADFGTLLLKILLLLALQFLLSSMGGFFEKRGSFYLKKFMRKHELRKAEHLLEIPYSWTEDNKMQTLMAEILSLEGKNVFSIPAFIVRINDISSAIAGIAVALALISKVFTGGVEVWGLPPWAFEAGFIIAFIGIFSLALKISARMNQRFGNLLGETSAPISRYLKAYNTLIYQYKSGKDIRLFNKGLAEKYTDTYRKFNGKIFDLMSQLLTKSYGTEAMMTGLSSGIVYLYISLKALSGVIEISEILMYVGGFSLLTQHVLNFVSSTSSLFAGDLFREKLKDYYNIGEKESQSLNLFESDSENLSSANTINVEPYCRVKGLGFRYPGSEKTVLESVSFEIGDGEKLAIVVENGSGKTTLIKVLTGLYNQYDGEIYIGGKNARKMTEKTKGSFFAPVFQDFKLLALTLRDNVTCFKGASDIQIKNVLNQVGMEKFCEKHGLDAYLTRGFEGTGVEVSGGEAQKIVMARAMMKNAPIFVLDEPTAALDPISEREIYEKFNEIIKGKTAVFISHRLSSCKFCDRILVLDKGKLVQTGSHETLLKDANGKYRELWNAQSKHYI